MQLTDGKLPVFETLVFGGHTVDEMARAAEKAPREFRDRVRLAIQFIGRAVRASEPFLFYWTAFEVLSSGAQGTRGDLAKAYGLKHGQHIDLATGFGKVSKARHDMIHSGIDAQLSASMERYVQLLLVDLLRFKLALEPQGHAIGLQLRRPDLNDELGVPTDWKRMFPGTEEPELPGLEPPNAPDV